MTPIIFWIEKTVPYKYREPIRDGILEWNKAFEKAGFSNAIEVRQQPDDADWDPEDINYNTFRWITANAGFAMGPSRVNPMTGQILDADIIFDADFIECWTSSRHFHDRASARNARPAARIEPMTTTNSWRRVPSFACRPSSRCDCEYRTAWPSSWPSARWPCGPRQEADRARNEKLIMQCSRA